MKKLFSILIVLMLVIPTGGIYYLFVLQKTQIERNFKAKLKAGIPKSDLLVFKFTDMNQAKTSSKLQWVKSYEFIYEGEFYDIVEEAIINDSLYLYCIHDFKDTQLAARKKKAFSEPPDDRTRYAPKYRVVLNWFFQVAKAHQPESFSSKSEIQFHYADNFQQIFLLPETPPPQRVVSFH